MKLIPHYYDLRWPSFLVKRLRGLREKGIEKHLAEMYLDYEE